jgi:hypothetical protein
MWPFLPKKCDCAETPTNPGTLCNENLQVASEYVYNGEDLSCIGIEHGDDLTTILQKIDYYLCSRAYTEYVLNYIENNIELFPEFIELVNGVINCETIQACGPLTTTTTSSSTSTSSTTTTTTTLPCNCFEVFAFFGDQVTYTDCENIEHIEIFEGTPSTIPPYVGATSKLYCAKSINVLEEAFIRDFGLCSLGSYCNPTTTTTTTSIPLTTTTTSSSSTTTTTSSSTTTTTTTTINPDLFPLQGEWQINSVNANVNINSINNLSGSYVSCVNALCNFPINSVSGIFTATPPTSDGFTYINTPPITTLTLNLSWVTLVPGATYYFQIYVNSVLIIPVTNVYYGTPVVTLNIPLVTGNEDVSIVFNGTV